MTVHWTKDQEAEFTQLWHEGMGVVALQRRFRVSQATMDKIRVGLGLETRASGFWTPALEAKAKQLYIVEGHSADETARRIGAASRNVIIGKAHRAGWMAKGRKPAAAPSVPRTHVRPPKPGPQNKPALIHGDYAPSSEAMRLARSAEGLAANDKVTSGAGVESPNARPWMENRRLGECNWPIGERGAVMSCCNPVQARGWCRGHFVMGTAVAQPKAIRPRDASGFARFDRVEKDRPARAPLDRTVWDDARAEAA